MKRIESCPRCDAPLAYVSGGAACVNGHEFTVYGAVDGLYPKDRRDVMHVPYDEFMRMLDLGAQLHNALVRYGEDGYSYESGETVERSPLGPSRRFMGRLLRICESMGDRFTERYGDENGNPLKSTALQMRTDGIRLDSSC